MKHDGWKSLLSCLVVLTAKQIDNIGTPPSTSRTTLVRSRDGRGAHSARGLDVESSWLPIALGHFWRTAFLYFRVEWHSTAGALAQRDVQGTEQRAAGGKTRCAENITCRRARRQWAPPPAARARGARCQRRPGGPPRAPGNTHADASQAAGSMPTHAVEVHGCAAIFRNIQPQKPCSMTCKLLQTRGKAHCQTFFQHR